MHKKYEPYNLIEKSGNYKNNFDLGYIPKKKFEEEINKYSFNWKSGGQFNVKLQDKLK